MYQILVIVNNSNRRISVVTQFPLYTDHALCCVALQYICQSTCGLRLIRIVLQNLGRKVKN
jgi:hypothetical protein